MLTLSEAWRLIASADSDLVMIVTLSLRVSLTATLVASALAIPAGAAVAIWSFPGRRVIVIVATSLMALPPVVVGLMVYLLLSRSGPLGDLGLLFTPGAMIIAQSVLIFPIVMALTREAILPLEREYRLLIRSVDAGPGLRMATLVWDARFAVTTAILAGFGRAIAEVGAVIIVGGNINGVTRIMTTTIALETSKGNLELALALGIILISIAFLVNALTHGILHLGQKYQVSR
ncbi:MAG: ABC transporter permease [Paracoccaceae bacterium]|nr:ABC transporter permease [Paracoccaceae bacterium]MDE2915417.1 ABC transporter permease [Paracoccaceae bacterium]